MSSKETGRLLSYDEAKALEERMVNEVGHGDTQSTFDKVASFLEKNVTPDRIARAFDIYRMYVSASKSGQSNLQAPTAGLYRALLAADVNVDRTVRQNLALQAGHDLSYGHGYVDQSVYHQDLQFAYDAMQNAAEERD